MRVESVSFSNSFSDRRSSEQDRRNGASAQDRRADARRAADVRHDRRRAKTTTAPWVHSGLGVQIIAQYEPTADYRADAVEDAYEAGGRIRPVAQTLRRI